MEVRKSIFLNSALFFGIAILAIVAVDLELRPLVLLTKPLLLILLSVWFFFSSRRYGDRFTLLIQTGLLFSLLGDIAFLFSYRNEFNFILGSGAFLIAVFAYALAFIQNIVEIRPRSGVWLSLLLTVFIGAFSLLFLRFLYPHLHELLYPVLALTGSITFMCFVAAFRFKRTYQRSFWMIMIGCVLFLLSNALMGVDRFVITVSGGNIAMNAMYALSQYLIVRGCLVHISRQIRQKAEPSAA